MLNTVPFPENELVIDNFAGGGGASAGIEKALGRPIDIAINHDPEAIAMHKANHPLTKHYCEDVFSIIPREVVGDRPVGLAWFSPDCKHFSKAKGNKPVSKKIRGLAWVAVRWADQVKPRIIALENVEEFQEWGPLTHACDKNGIKQYNPDGTAKMLPCPVNKGMIFHEWKRKLESYGYEVDYRELRACDYGAPTIRKRLFIVARCDGLPITWPDKTHGEGLSDPYHSAAECIDWSVPCKSVFDRPRLLADKTCQRIAKGIKRYVIDDPNPFIIRICQTGWNGRHAYPLDEPLTTIVSKNEHCLVYPSVIKHFGGMVGTKVTNPLPTITAKGTQNQLLSAFVKRDFGQSVGQTMLKPCPTIMPDGMGKTGIAAAHLTKFNGKSSARSVDAPAPTITGRNKTGIVSSQLIKLYGTCKDGQDIRKPMPTVTAGGQHLGEVRGLIIKYYGTAVGQDLKSPLHSVTSKGRFGLVQAEAGGCGLTEEERYSAWMVARFMEVYGPEEPAPLIPGPRPSMIVIGDDLVLYDITMRMFESRELFTAQGFESTYVLNPEFNGKPLTKTAQIRMCGNSVSPKVAEAVVLANTVTVH